MDWGFVHKAWEKWASTNIGSSSEPLQAALLINYDPSGPSRFLSTILVNVEQAGSNVEFYIFLKEQEGIKLSPTELCEFVDFIKRNNLQIENFTIGQKQYLVTSVYENWFCARCLNTSKPAGEGVIIMQTVAFLLVALYDGSLGAASRAMAAVDQFTSQLNRKYP